MDTKISSLVLGDVMQYPVMWPGADQAVYPDKAYGLCDDEMWASRNGAVGFRFDQALLPLTSNAGLSLAWAANASVSFFGTKGQTESGSSEGYPLTFVLTESETDAFKTGALTAREDEQFFIYAMGFQISRPFQMDQTAPLAPIDNETTFLRAYAQTIEEKVSDKFGVSIFWPDTKCSYGIGKLKFWPSHNDTVGETIPAMSNRVGAMGLWGLRRPVIAGYRTSEDLITITAQAGFGAVFPNDVAFPIPAATATLSIVVPITCIAYGVSVKRNRCIVCVGGQATTIDELVNTITRRLNGK